jgi:hypothetical protein
MATFIAIKKINIGKYPMRDRYVVVEASLIPLQKSNTVFKKSDALTLRGYKILMF